MNDPKNINDVQRMYSKMNSKLYKNYYFVSASHNGYEKKFGYIHKRSITVLKEKDKIIGCDELKDQIPTKNVFHEYINPERAVSPEAFKVHGWGLARYNIEREVENVIKLRNFNSNFLH